MMKARNTQLRSILVTAILACSAARAEAAGYATTDRSVIAMGAGGTGVARASDPGSSAYNPAAMVFARGLEAQLGAVLAAPSLSAQGSGLAAETESSLVVPPLFHARYSSERFGLGASFFVPYGSNVVWPKDWSGRFELVEARLRVFRATLFGAFRFGSISVGAGPFLDVSTLSLVKAIDFIDAEGSTRIQARATGVGAMAGVFWNASESLAFGLSYQSRSKLSFAGTADFDVPAEFRARTPDQDVHTRIVLPDRVSLGSHLVLTPEWSVDVDLELSVWSTVDSLALDFAAESTPDTVLPRDWRTTLTPRAGVSFAPSALDFLVFRAGAFIDPSPVPATTVTPSSPDSTRIGLTAGARAAILEDLAFDLGYSLLMFSGIRSETETLTLSPGVDYRGHSHLLGLSLSYGPRG